MDAAMNMWLLFSSLVTLLALQQRNANAQLNQLVPGGANICSKNVSQLVNVTVETQRVVTEQYRTCCNEKWGTCLNECMKSRSKTVTEQKVVTKTVTAVVYTCCAGFTRDGGQCKTDKVLCDPPCLNGDCTDSGTCICQSGYQGDKCETDIDECSDASVHQCQQLCQNSDGSFSCACNAGYALASDGKSCSDVDECSTGSHSCEHDCVNNDGSYACLCRVGFQLGADGSACQDINECTDKTHSCNQNCQNNAGSYTCSCNPGYNLAADGKACIDIDECVPGLNGCEHKCLNNAGSYVCECRLGYVLGSDGLSCQDVDECQVGSAQCVHICVNTDGSFSCTCRPGFTLAADLKSCQDIDECMTGAHSCEQTCTNAIGSFRCGCRDGYKLNSDKETCRSEIQFNVLFILQSDRRMSSQIRKNIINVAIEMIDRFPTQWDVRVGAIQSDSAAHNVFKLGQYSTSNEMMKKALIAMQPRQDGPTCRHAIDKATEMLSSSQGEGRHFIVYVGNGRTSRHGGGIKQTRVAATKAQAQNITVFAIATGRHIDAEGIVSMVSYPKEKHTFLMDKSSVSTAQAVIAAIKVHFQDICLDPLVDIGVVAHDLCKCRSQARDRKMKKKVGQALRKIAKDLSPYSRVGFFGGLFYRKVIVRFDADQRTTLLLWRTYRLLSHYSRLGRRRRRGHHGHRHRHHGHRHSHHGRGHHRRHHRQVCFPRNYNTVMRNIYNEYFNEMSGAIAKFKVLAILSCEPLKKQDLFNFTKLYPNEVIVPINLVLQDSTTSDSFSFSLSQIDDVISKLKQERDYAKICYHK